MFLSQHAAGSVWGYGLFILETVIGLGGIAAVGYLIVRLTKHRTIAHSRQGRMRLVEQLSLAPRRDLHLVEIDGRPFLIGTSEQAVHLLAPLDPGAPDLVDSEDGGTDE